MTKEQVLELAALQRSIFDTSINRDQSKLLEQIEVTIYWIRKQIWKRVQGVMIDVDLGAALKFQTEHVKFTDHQRKDFLQFQYNIVREEELKSDYRRDLWVNYIRWVDEIMNLEFARHTKKYLNVKIKREK